MVTKEFRDKCLTAGIIGLVTVTTLFLGTLVTGLKLGKISLFIVIASIILVVIGMSDKNRLRLKAMISSKSLF